MSLCEKDRAFVQWTIRNFEHPLPGGSNAYYGKAVHRWLTGKWQKSDTHLFHTPFTQTTEPTKTDV